MNSINKTTSSWPVHHPAGSALIIVLILTVVLAITGMGLLTVSTGELTESIRIKSLDSAAAAAEAGYEKAVFWMSQQTDLLNALEETNQTIAITFPQSKADYKITFESFVGARPVFKIEANGYHGIYKKTITTQMVQAVAGWEMGRCRVISDSSQTTPVNFFTNEIIAMPIHINDLMDNPDSADIYISGTPQFKEYVSMGEDRYTSGGTDKYKSLIKLFPKGISFGQPTSRIIDSETLETKIQRFYDATNAACRLTPQANQTIPMDSKGQKGFYSTVSKLPAVHLKFYVKNNQGFVRIYNNCTIAGYTRGGTSSSTWDYKIDPSKANTYIKYPIYGCHYGGSYTDVRIDDSSQPIYVSQDFHGIKSEPGAQIYIDGNVIIGCSSEDAATLGTLNTVKGRISIAATGNIWIANELKVYGERQADGMPAADNLNIVGLISQGVVKVIDPGMTTNDLLYDTSKYNATKVSGYSPVGIKDGTATYSRVLPETMTVEAAITVGGGGWGAENVYRSFSYSDRKNYNTNASDKLIIRGTLSEAVRGVVGSGTNGYIKQYYYDQRITTGILPSNIWLKGKYIIIPGGWSEVSTVKCE